MLSTFNFFENSRFFINQRYTYLNQLPNQLITNSFNPVSDASHTFTQLSTTAVSKLNITQSYFLNNIHTSTQLYHPSYGTSSIVESASINKMSMMSNSNITNVHATRVFTDLLQNTDLQSLNTINTASPSAKFLQLNQNVSNSPRLYRS